MDLQLVQHPGLDRPLRRVRAVHQYVAVSGGSLRLSHRAGDPVGHVRHQRIVGHRGTGWPMAGYEDRDTATMMITAPVIDLLGGTPTDQHRTGRHCLVEQLPGRPGRPEELPVLRDEPLVQPAERVAAGVAWSVVRTRDVPVD